MARGYSLCRIRVLGGAACGFLALVCGYGCGSRGAPKHSTSVADLHTIGRAYARATDELGHPPRSKEEFMPSLKEILADSENVAKEQADSDKPIAADAPKRTAEEVMRSDSDGKEFVIHWGVDGGGSRGPKAPVLAYERDGKDGQRYVLQGTRMVRPVKDSDFANLPFPSGFSPP